MKTQTQQNFDFNFDNEETGAVHSGAEGTVDSAYGATVLVADDDHATRMLIKSVLELEGYNVVTADNGQNAIEIYRDASPEIVLMDALMPHMNGFAACEELNKIYGDAVAPVLIITSLEDQQSVEKAFDAGSSDFITKPIHWPVLLKRVNRIITARRTASSLQEERQQARDARESYEKQLRQAHKMEALGQLTGGIAHDFNNILASIMGYGDLLSSLIEREGTEKMTAYLSEIITAAERARDLIKQMLIFSREEKLDRKYTNPVLIVTEVVRLLKSTLPSSIQMHSHYQESVPDIQVDPAQLHQVVMNLCINARDAMSGSGNIYVEVTAGENKKMVCNSCHQAFAGYYVCIKLRDTGSGIDDETLRQMFDPFFTTKPVGRGTGMGLSVVHGILHQCQGHVCVETEQGKGTEIALYFTTK